jgi:hypothetical protein
MEALVKAGEWMLMFGPDVISAVVLLLSGVAGIAMLIPGDEPEKSIKAVADWLAQFSRKE